MTPSDFDRMVIAPGLALLPERMRSIEARVLLLAIAGQESHWSARTQAGGGPAHGYYQCEMGGGVAGAFQNVASHSYLRAACRELDVPSDEDTIYAAIVWCDPLATVVARLILWSDPAPLPKLGDQDTALKYYTRCWRPGKPRPADWPAAYAAAMAEVTA